MNNPKVGDEVIAVGGNFDQGNFCIQRAMVRETHETFVWLSWLNGDGTETSQVWGNDKLFTNMTGAHDFANSLLGQYLDKLEKLKLKAIEACRKAIAESV